MRQGCICGLRTDSCKTSRQAEDSSVFELESSAREGFKGKRNGNGEKFLFPFFEASTVPYRLLL